MLLNREKTPTIEVNGQKIDKHYIVEDKEESVETVFVEYDDESVKTVTVEDKHSLTHTESEVLQLSPTVLLLPKCGFILF